MGSRLPKRTQNGPGLDRALLGVAAVVILGSFMSTLDTTIVNVAINTLGRRFHTSLSTIQWVSTGYLLALATVIPLSGWAADRFGTKRLYLGSIAIFIAGSALAGAAWSAGSLITFRVLQGLGGGMIMPAGITIVTRTAGPHRVGRAMSLIGAPMLLGPIVGPILGGWLIQDASWRWIFYINVPIALLALLAGARLLPADRPAPSDRLDWRGTLLLSPGLVGLIYGLSRGEDGGIARAGALLPMLTGLTLIGLFALHALRTDRPLIDVRLFRRGAMPAATVATLLLDIAFIGVMFMLPLYFQLMRGQSTLDTGLLIAPLGLGAAATMALTGRIADRVPARTIALAGMVPFIAGVFGLTQVAVDPTLLYVAVCTLLIGIGSGATQMQVMTAALKTLAHSDTARANTVLIILMRVGASIGVALLSLVLIRSLDGVGSLAYMPQTLHSAHAFATAFWWATAFTVAAVVPVSLLPRMHSAPAESEPPTVEPLSPAPDEAPATSAGSLS